MGVYFLAVFLSAKKPKGYRRHFSVQGSVEWIPGLRTLVRTEILGNTLSRKRRITMTTNDYDSSTRFTSKVQNPREYLGQNPRQVYADDKKVEKLRIRCDPNWMIRPTKRFLFARFWHATKKSNPHSEFDFSLQKIRDIFLFQRMHKHFYIRSWWDNWFGGCQVLWNPRLQTLEREKERSRTTSSMFDLIRLTLTPE